MASELSNNIRQLEEVAEEKIVLSREDVLNLFGRWNDGGPDKGVELFDYVVCSRHNAVEDRGRDFAKVEDVPYYLAIAALGKVGVLLKSADCIDYRPKAEAKPGVRPQPPKSQQQPHTVTYPTQPQQQVQAPRGAYVEELLPHEAGQQAERSIQQGTQFQLETTQARVRAYERKPYTFANNASLLNGMLSLLEHGYRINPEDHSEIIFTGQEYLARTPQAMRAQEEAVRRLIEIDKRIEVQIAGRVETRMQLEAIISSALQNPAATKGAREIVKNYFAQPN